jgi:predicted transport protein
VPIFKITEQTLSVVEQTNFSYEKELQGLVEKNLETLFGCRFVASEFSTGSEHAGRIDTLALSEENNPVIIEYKKAASSSLITQSLFYLSWISDHRGDFEIAVQKELGVDVGVDWSDVRVICLAPDYKKYDLHAVQVMGANIELWRYRLFADGIFHLEDVFQSAKAVSPETSLKNPIMVEAGKKAAQTRSTGSYRVEEHFEGKPEKIRELAQAIKEYICDLDSMIEEVPKKFYIAYKISKNIVCMEVKNRDVKLFVKLDPATVQNPPVTFRDVSKIGHYGTGDCELTLKNLEEFEAVKPLIEMAYNKMGG